MISQMAGAPNEWIEQTCAEEGLSDSYATNVIEILRPLADHVLGLRKELSRPVAIGINGGQGSGKSTLSLFLVEWLNRECGLSAVCLSLDDLYYGKARRLELAQSIHRLFATRGVPGTHDVALGMQILDTLLGIRGDGTLAMPKFNKATDDLLDEAEWPEIEVPVDVVMFEGWCVGARTQSDAELSTAINVLEADEDPDGRWRRAVNEHLKTDYAELFQRLDMLVMLRIPSFEKAIEWRQLQESKSGGPLDEKQLMRFMMFFERLTRHMLETVPSYADTVIDIDDQHNLVKTDQT
jgi:D-glycerate 3-kinase